MDFGFSLFSFWFDATVTLIRRKMQGEKLSEAHKKHAYQRLTQAGWSHKKVTLSSICLNLVIFCIVYFLPYTLLSCGIVLILLSLVYIFIERKKKFA